MTTVLRMLFGRPAPSALSPDATDAELVARVLAGETLAASMFFERFAPVVERVICKTLAHDAEREDAVSEVFARALAGLSALPSDAKVGGWMVGVAANVAREFRRKSRRPQWQTQGRDSVPEMLASLADDDTRFAARAVFEVCARLDEADSELVLLRWFSSLDLAELADLRGVSLATIKRRVSRAESIFFEAAAREPHLASWVQRMNARETEAS